MFGCNVWLSLSVFTLSPFPSFFFLFFFLLPLLHFVSLLHTLPDFSLSCFIICRPLFNRYKFKQSIIFIYFSFFSERNIVAQIKKNGSDRKSIIEEREHMLIKGKTSITKSYKKKKEENHRSLYPPKKIHNLQLNPYLPYTRTKREAVRKKKKKRKIGLIEH